MTRTDSRQSCRDRDIKREPEHALHRKDDERIELWSSFRNGQPINERGTQGHANDSKFKGELKRVVMRIFPAQFERIGVALIQREVRYP